MSYLILLAVYAIGVAVAWAFGKYIISVQHTRAVSAAGWDFLTLMMTHTLVLSIWSMSGDSPIILFGYAVGNATGTYMLVRKNEDNYGINP